MTKTIVIGEQPQLKQLKPIEFLKVLNNNLEMGGIKCNNPAASLYIELICKQYLDREGTDLMFAYDDPNNRSEGMLVMGNWNDGVVK